MARIRANIAEIYANIPDIYPYFNLKFLFCEEKQADFSFLEKFLTC